MALRFRPPLPTSVLPQRLSRIDWTVLALLVLFTVGSRLPFLSKYLFEGDSVNFALSMEHYDVSQHRPHAPGYLLFIGIAKIFTPLALDNNQALVYAAILLSVVAVAFLYLLGRDMFGREVGVASSVAFLFVPIFWFHGEVALSYSGGACFSILIAYCAYRILIDPHQALWTYIAVFCLGLSGGFRQDLIMFLFPLVLFSVYLRWQSAKTVLYASIVLGLTVAAWYIPLIVLSNGYAAYSKALNDQFSYYATEYSVLFGNPVFTHFLMAKDFLVVLLGGSIFVLLYALAYVFSFKIMSLALFGTARFLFLAFWFLPSALFFTIVFYQAAGYVLTPLPAFYIVLGYCIVAFAKKLVLPESVNRAIAFQLVALTAIHGYIFLGEPPFTFGSAPGKPFTEKSWSETAATVVYKGFYRNTNYTTHHVDEATRIYSAGIRALKYEPEEVTILAFHRASWSASLAWYYLPEYSAYYIQDYRPVPDKIKFGKNHWVIEVAESTIRLSPKTRCVVVICEEEGPSYRLVNEQVLMKKVALDKGMIMYLIEQSSPTIHYKNIVFTAEKRG